MKRLSTIILITIFTLFASTTAMAQSLNNTLWPIFQVRQSTGFERSDVWWTGSSLSTTAKIVNNKLYLGKEIYCLLNEKVVKKNFALDRSYNFKDQYGQKGDILFSEDPSCVDTELRYVIFIKYENNEEGRAFICREPKSLKDNESNEEHESLFIKKTGEINVDTTSQTASKASDTLIGGHASGKAIQRKYQSEANAHLKGRNVIGSILAPQYVGKEEAKVVVTIWVDQYGKVTEAYPGAEGTTIADKKLWAACRTAAMKAHFNKSADAPVKQEGSITYIFKVTE